MTTLGIIWLICLLWMTVSLIFYRPRKMGGLYDHKLIKDRTKTNFNLIALYFNLRNGEFIDKDFLTRFKPLTPLQKEIREEERTIKQLEAQRADMERLEELVRKRVMLFEEVGDKHVEGAGVRLTSHIVEPDGITHQNTYFCHRCEKNKTLNMMTKENPMMLICKKCEEEI
ncbi:hypothetical protein [Salinicoccus carnicancri]|uniref:hypothetical protein n=1 Tax=Salinicoccus carnicancri TaxID=558170 RepID=UPI00031EE350|nr:hypothetical protein [Salinicoccus carnicancri]